MDSSRLEIRKIKYNAYIDKHPNKPYGYYALGELELMSRSYNSAMTYFTKALAIDENYARAKIGYILCLLHEKKYIKAIKFYKKKCKVLSEKKILLRDLVHGISSKTPVTNPIMFKPVDCRKVNINGLFKYWRILRQFKKKNNIVAGMLLVLQFYNNNLEKYDKIKNEIFGKLVYQKGINEKLRWFMIKSLAEDDDSILNDEKLASQFNYIPTQDFSNKYANKIFSCALKEENDYKISRIYKSFNDSFVTLNNENMWHYVYLAYQKNNFNSSIMQCCKSLIKAGWLDSVVANSVLQMKEMNLSGLTKKEEKIIKLYGY